MTEGGPIVHGDLVIPNTAGSGPPLAWWSIGPETPW